MTASSGQVLSLRPVCRRRALRRLRRDGAPVPLRPKSFDVLPLSRAQSRAARLQGRAVRERLGQCRRHRQFAGPVHQGGPPGARGRRPDDDRDRRQARLCLHALGRSNADATRSRQAALRRPIATGSSDSSSPVGAAAGAGRRPAAMRRHRRAPDRRRAVVGVEPARDPANSPPRLRPPTARRKTASRSRCCHSAYWVKPPTTISRSASAKTLQPRSAAFPTSPSLRRRSSRVFAASAPGNDDIQRQLKVRYLVEGSVRRTPERIRIAVRLTDLPRGTLLWSESYDCVGRHDLRDRRRHRPQDRRRAGGQAHQPSAGAIGRNVDRQPGGLRSRPARARPAYALEPHRAFAGAHDVRTRHRARSAIRRGLCRPRSHRPERGGARLDGGPRGGAAARRGAARKAISLDEFNPAAHVLLGRAYARMGEYERAVEALKRAVALNPSEPDSYAGLGDALLWNGDVDGAIKSLETAIGNRSASVGGRPAQPRRRPISWRDGARMRRVILERIITRKEGNPFIYAMLAAAYVRERPRPGFTVGGGRGPQAQSVLRRCALRLLVQKAPSIATSSRRR